MRDATLSSRDILQRITRSYLTSENLHQTGAASFSLGSSRRQPPRKMLTVKNDARHSIVTDRFRFSAWKRSTPSLISATFGVRVVSGTLRAVQFLGEDGEKETETEKLDDEESVKPVETSGIQDSRAELGEREWSPYEGIAIPGSVLGNGLQNYGSFKRLRSICVRERSDLRRILEKWNLKSELKYSHVFALYIDIETSGSECATVRVETHHCAKLKCRRCLILRPDRANYGSKFGRPRFEQYGPIVWESYDGVLK